VPEYDKPQTVRLDHVNLLTALDAIAMQCRLHLEVAPDMPNPDIRLDAEGKSGLQILQDLGNQYGFSAFDQGNGNVLIIPARENGEVEPGNVKKVVPLDSHRDHPTGIG
jgi:hypothetical protein